MRWLALLSTLVLVSCSPASDSTTLTPDQMMTNGGQVYAQYCAACHQVDGSGVANMQPALKGNAIVSGDPKQLIQVVLKGPAAVLPANRPHFQNVMPGFAILTDEQVAELLTYIRAKFGNNASAVQPKDVAAVRATIQ